MREFLLLFSMARRKWPWLLLGLVCSVATLLANMALLTLAAWFLASMALAGASGALFNYFLPAAGIRALALLRVIGRYGERLFSHDAALRLLAELRVRFFERLAPLAPAGLGTAHSADLLSRMRADIDLLDNFYLRLLLPAGAALCVGFFGFVFLSVFDFTLAMGVLGLWLMVGVFLPFFVLRAGAAPGERQVAGLARMRCLAVDGLNGLEELLAYGAAGRHRRVFAGESRRVLKDQVRLAGLDGLSLAAVGLASGLAGWLALLIGMPHVQGGVWPPAVLPMLAVFALVSFEAVQPLPAAWRMWGQIRTATARIMDVTERPAPIPDPSCPLAVPERFDLDLRGVRFAYPGVSRPVLDGLDLALPAGRRTAVLGAAGSGKTTLLHLLTRFWEAEQGRILLNGRDIREYAAEEVRERMAVVSQHVYLFNASIAENLRLADPRASDEKLFAAAKAANIEDFILSLPQGLDSPVGPYGTRLSGGQARRLAVARALLKDAPVLLLDEPTEGLDEGGEAALWGTLEPLMHDRTVLLITHRPAGLEYMDQVHSLEGGRLVRRD
jgi:ATP-binding cassette, subfamily C, bacterial CydC